jgi:hypothetical protein
MEIIKKRFLMVKGIRITGYILVKNELPNIGVTGDKKPDRRNGSGKNTSGDERDDILFPFSLNEEIEKHDASWDHKACRAFCEDRERSRDEGKHKQGPPVLCDGNIIEKDRETYEKSKGHVHHRFSRIGQILIVCGEHKGRQKTALLIDEHPAEKKDNEQKERRRDR